MPALNSPMELKKATLSDISALQYICRNSYSQIFADHWNANGLELYLEREFGTDRLQTELNSPEYVYFLIKKDSENIGFIKINTTSSAERSELNNCELEKIYLLPKYSGRGIGKMAMTEIIDRVRQKGKIILFLCVIDTNSTAIAFYMRLGFKFHSKTRLEVPHFKEELKGMHRMSLRLN